MTDYAKARTNMVDSQLRPNRITDPAVVAAFLDVRRELFVPDGLKATAYFDEDLPIGRQRFLMEPMVLARLIQSATIHAQDVVLEVGAGTGYGAAILSRLAKTVVAVEPDGNLAGRARLALTDRANVTVVERACAEGCTEHGPYDVILLGGAVGAVPASLLSQVAEGGRLLGVIRTREDAPGEACIFERVGGAWSRRPLFDAGIHTLPGLATAPSFSF